MVANSEDILYHYCTTDTLYKILNDGALHLTNIRYMSDCKEISWLFELAKVVLKRRRQFTESGAETELFDELVEFCENLYLDDTYFPNVFCSCFSMDGDSLGQWRAYADDGKGVAIGFSKTYLASLATSYQTKLEPVRYLKVTDGAKFEQDIDEALAKLRSTSIPLCPDGISALVRATKDKWENDAPFCKNFAFHEESEVRLVHVRSLVLRDIEKSGMGAKKFRCRQGVVTPYLERKLDPNAHPIVKINLGPKNRFEHNRSAISDFAASKDFRGIQIDVSSASYGESWQARKTLHM